MLTILPKAVSGEPVDTSLLIGIDEKGNKGIIIILYPDNKLASEDGYMLINYETINELKNKCSKDEIIRILDALYSSCTAKIKDKLV